MIKCIMFSSVSLFYSLNSEQFLVSNFNEKEYASVERIFANNTGHIDNLADFVHRLELSGSFLDIGAGPAAITERLSHDFSSTFVVEPNREFASIYQAKQFKYHIGNFQDIKIEGTYDFVLCSHVLYHVPQKEWAPFLKKMHGLLNPNGKGLVLMVAPTGKWHALRSSINPHYSCSSQVEKALQQENIAYELMPIQSVFKVEDYEDFRALVRLFTIEDCYLPEEYSALTVAEKKAIDDRIDAFISNCEQPDGSYIFMDEDMYIVLYRT